MSNQTMPNNKGEKGGCCNRSACLLPAEDDPDGVRWYNHSTRKYYCWACAMELNRYNRKDAMELFGHDLCTLEQP